MLKIGALLVSCTALLLLAFAGYDQKAKLTIEEVESLIKTEIPVGSSKERVLSFLESHHIEHSAIELSDIDVVSLGDDDPLDKRKEIKAMIHAAIRNVESTLTSTTGIFMKFYFDAQGNLLDYRIGKASTGV